MTSTELKQKSTQALEALLAESRDKLREMRFKVAQRQLKNVREVRRLKREVARILTLLKLKEKERENKKL